MLLIGKTTPKELEHLIGRLSHLGLVVPFVNHFLSRLRDIHHRSKNWRGVTLLDKYKKDLELMLHFLEIGRKGVGMNLIPYLAPMHVYHSDLCPAGLGGYSNEGFVWRTLSPNQGNSKLPTTFSKFLQQLLPRGLTSLPIDCIVEIAHSR
jgi:hypothetical protein